MNGTPTKYPMGVGKMTVKGGFSIQKHALGFGREPEQGGSEHERVYRKITANAASTVYDGSESKSKCALWITAPRTV